MRTVILATATALAFSVYPILYLLAENLDRMYASDSIRTFVIASVVGLVVFFGAWVAFEDSRKATLFVPAFVLLLFLQKPVNTVLRVSDIGIGGLSLVSLLSMLLLGLYALKLRRTKGDVTPFFHTSSLIALALLILPVISIIRFEVQNTARLQLGNGSTRVAVPEAGTRAIGRKPDIYYIILDTYGRADALRELYAYDNSGFVAELEQRGFYVAPKSRSNYAYTIVSVSSSLNFTYLDQILEPIRENTDRSMLDDVIKDNAAARFLRSQDYTYISIGNGWSLSSPNPYAEFDVVADGPVRNQFELMVLDLLPIAAIESAPSGYAPYEHRERVLFQFRAVGKIGSARSPKFVYAHILCPHQPFAFDEHGNLPQEQRSWAPDKWDVPGTRDLYKRLYIAQLPVLNAKILETVDAIRAHYEPDEQPIIILQGDHGPSYFLRGESFDDTNFYERMSILNAYHIPPDVSARFSDDASPVNTFRVLFNALFDTKLEILPNRHFYTRWSKPYQVTQIPEERMEPGRVEGGDSGVAAGHMPVQDGGVPESVREGRE